MLDGVEMGKIKQPLCARLILIIEAENEVLFVPPAYRHPLYYTSRDDDDNII